MKIVDNIFAWVGKKLDVTYSERFDFEIYGNVLVVHVPCGRLPPGKAEEYVKANLEKLTPLKDDFGVTKIFAVAKRG